MPPLELTHPGQKEWKTEEKWSSVYAESGGSTLLDIYGRGLTLAKSLLGTGLLTSQVEQVLVIGSAAHDLANELKSSCKAKSGVWHWQKGGAPERRGKQQTSQSAKLQQLPADTPLQPGSYDLLVDNGELDWLYYSNGFNSSKNWLKERLDCVRRELVIYTVVHDAFLRDLIRLVQERDDIKVLVMRLSQPTVKSIAYLPFPVAICLVKTGVEGDEALTKVSDSIADKNVLIRQPVNQENCWTYREAQVNLLRLPRLFKEWKLDAFISRIVPAHVDGKLRLFNIIDQEGQIAYSISMYDRRMLKLTPKAFRELKPCVAVMVPLADEHHWLYRTVSGHQRLAEKAETKRVLCVFLPSFRTLSGADEDPAAVVQRIRQDIGAHLVQLNSSPNKPVYLMTQQERLEDERIVVARVTSKVQGEILVYDVPVDKHDEEFKEDPEQDAEYHSLEPSEYTRRTLIMAQNPRVAQTELWYSKPSDADGSLVFEFTHICHSYQIPILQAVHAMLNQTTCQLAGALLGTGGGLMYSLFHKVFGGALSLDCVDLDEDVVKFAVDYFGYKNENTIIANALTYVADKAVSEHKLDFLIVDINGSLGATTPALEDVTGPHRDFLTPNFLHAAASSASASGCVMFNSVCQTSQAKKALGAHLKSFFPKVVSAVYGDELNVVYLCSSNENQYFQDCLSDIRNKFLAAIEKYPALAEVVEKTPLYLGEKSKTRLSVQAHKS